MRASRPRRAAMAPVQTRALPRCRRPHSRRQPTRFPLRKDVWSRRNPCSTRWHRPSPSPARLPEEMTVSKKCCRHRRSAPTLQWVAPNETPGLSGRRLRRAAGSGPRPPRSPRRHEEAPLLQVARFPARHPRCQEGESGGGPLARESAQTNRWRMAAVSTRAAELASAETPETRRRAKGPGPKEPRAPSRRHSPAHSTTEHQRSGPEPPSELPPRRQGSWAPARGGRVVW